LFEALSYKIHNFTLESLYSEDYRKELLNDGIANPIKKDENPVDIIMHQPNKLSNVKDINYFYDDFSSKKDVFNILKPENIIQYSICTKCILTKEDDPKIFFN